MAKKLNILGIVSAVLVLVGLILSIVGMCVPVLFNGKLDISIKLFDESWDALKDVGGLASVLGQSASVPDRTFTIIAFVVLLVSGAASLANSVLMMLGKNIKLLGILAGVAMLLGGVLVLAAGLWLAIDYSDFMHLTGENSLLPATGVWLGLVGGLLGGISGIVTTKKAAKKK